MKRDSALRDLSSEHHSALVLIRRIRKASASPEFQSAATWSVVIERFEREMEPHSQKEEQGLLPALSAIGEHALVERTLREHRAMRDLVAKADPKDLARFARLLSDHIRFEERELFEVAQRRLSTDRLAVSLS
jgi:hemerythrin-like domain-containing protein